MPRLRLSLTISGAARFGPFEGGVLAALVVASRSLGEETLVIDSIASAAVGSINDLLTARSLLGGVDPVTLFDATWVRKDGVENPDRLPNSPVTARQNEPVRLSMALSNIESLVGEQPGPDGVRDDPGGTAHAMDWYSVELTSAATPCDFVALVHAATWSRCADTSSAFGAATHAARPLGRTIDLAQQIASDDERLYLVVDPDPTRLSIMASAYDDLTRLGETRSHIEWIEREAPDGCDHALDALRHQGDVVAEARRIMTEREADRSHDYAALLESLVRSTHHSDRRSSGRRGTTESRHLEFALGYRTMSSWLERRLHVYLAHRDLSSLFDRVDQEYERLGAKSLPAEATRASPSSGGLASLEH